MSGDEIEKIIETTCVAVIAIMFVYWMLFA